MFSKLIQAKRQFIYIGFFLSPFALFSNDLSANESCTLETQLTSHESWTSPGGSGKEIHCYRAPIEASGLLAIEVSAAGPSSHPPVLMHFGFEGWSEKDRAHRLREAPTVRLAALAGPGEVSFRIAPQDPSHGLPPYRLDIRHVSFDSLSKSEHDDELEPDPYPLTHCGAPKGEHDDELEPDPYPLTHCGAPKGEHDDELEPDPYPLTHCGAPKGEHDDELEPDPYPVCGSPYDLAKVGVANRWRRALCEGSDDHSARFLCATELDLTAGGVGEISKDQLRDQDLFIFHLTEPRTLTFETPGMAVSFGELFDHRGQSLQRTRAEDGDWRLVRTLSPGSYFLRLEGQAEHAGAYGLRTVSAKLQ